MLNTRWLLMVALAIPPLAHAAPLPQPIPKNGACPGSYSTQGQYCVPSGAARVAIAKTGSCPSGYSTSGNYCVATSASSRAVIPKSGSCPSGWYTSGAYCVSNRQ
jgi:hypothetical protein